MCFFTEQYSDTMCLLTGVSPEDWSLDDIQKKKITEHQKQVLSSLDKMWKYIAKDNDGEVNVYEFKPYKSTCFFDEDAGSCYCISDLFPEDMFNYLPWQDDEATLIADLLK